MWNFKNSKHNNTKYNGKKYHTHFIQQPQAQDLNKGKSQS